MSEIKTSVKYAAMARELFNKLRTPYNAAALCSADDDFYDITEIIRALERAALEALSTSPFYAAVRDCGIPSDWELTDPRMHYVTVQIDKDQWLAVEKGLTALRARLAELDAETK
jgi:hypothetical protein